MQNIAIIGSGPTAIYTLKFLLLQQDELAITIFESQAEAGKGTPYHQNWNDKEMLANIASIEIPPITETLLGWLESRPDEELLKMGIVRELITDRTFFPRVALGEYFHAQLEKLLAGAAKTKCRVTLKTLHKVVDVKVVEDGIHVSVRLPLGNVTESVFDYVVMATGHAWPTETEIRPGYFLSPWPASALRVIHHCQVGIRGTSLTAIDAAVALSVARGSFMRGEDGVLAYRAEPGTEDFRITMMSRKGVLPEADFYFPTHCEPLKICTHDAVRALIDSPAREHLLDDVYALFKAELMQYDRNYAHKMNLATLTLEEFTRAYFKERESENPFVWAERNLAEAKENDRLRHTVPWRNAIVLMHEVIATAVPHLSAEDYARFTNHFKAIFVDDYATVPHESIERLLALHRAGKLDVMALGEQYELTTDMPLPGAMLMLKGQRYYFPAFIEATGQRPLSPHEFPFKSLWEQGLLEKAQVLPAGKLKNSPVDIGGIDLDTTFHPVCGSPSASRLYCLSLPFMLGQFPFIQGITSSHAMGEIVAKDLLQQCSEAARLTKQCSDYEEVARAV